MKTIPKIVTLTPSARWRSSVQFHLAQAMSDARIWAALDFENCLSEVGQLQPVAAIVELTPNRLPAHCATLGQRLSEFPYTIFLAVGDQDLRPWLRLLRISGFADICCDVAETGTLCERVKRHADAIQANRAEVKLETAILDQIPWKAIRTGTDSKRLHLNQGQE